MLSALKLLYNRYTDRSHYLEKMNEALDEIEDSDEDDKVFTTNQETKDKQEAETQEIIKSGNCFR